MPRVCMHITTVQTKTVTTRKVAEFGGHKILSMKLKLSFNFIMLNDGTVFLEMMMHYGN
jgi:hypothetical protein